MSSELVVTLGSLIASLGGLRTAGVKDAHIELLREQLQVIKDRVVQLEEENAKLTAALAEANQERARQRKTAETKEHRGALWVRKAPGVYGETPLCPRCGSTMTAPGRSGTFTVHCGNPHCGHQ